MARNAKIKKETYTVRFKLIDTRNYDGTGEGFERAYENAPWIYLHGVEDIDDAVNEYRNQFPAGRYDIDDVMARPDDNEKEEF